MFVVDAAALLKPQARPPRRPEPLPAAAGIRGLPTRLMDALQASRRLRQRQRALPRPAGCRWLPRRAWRRHSALICLRAGIDPDAAPEETAG